MDWFGGIIIAAFPVVLYVFIRYARAANEKPRIVFLSVAAFREFTVALTIGLLVFVGLNVLWREVTGSLLLAPGIAITLIAVGVLALLVGSVVMFFALLRWDRTRRAGQSGADVLRERASEVQDPGGYHSGPVIPEQEPGP